MFSSWKNSRFYIWISLNVDVKFPLHRMLVYVNCGHFRWKLSLASQPPWFPSPPPLSPARTSSPRCSPAPCRSSCTWTVDMWGIFWQPLLHRWPNNKSVWQGETETEIFNPSTWIFSKTGACLFVLVFLSKVGLAAGFLTWWLCLRKTPWSRCVQLRLQPLYILSSTFVHINFNLFTYQSKP